MTGAERAEKVAIKDVVLDELIYPRKSVSDELIETYISAMQNGDSFPPISIEKGTNRLLDGLHRFRAMRALKLTEATVEFVTVPKGDTARYYSAKLNARHGARLTNSELKDIAIEMAEANPDEEASGMETRIARDLAVPCPTVNGWIGAIYRTKKWARDALIRKLDLLGWTQQETGAVVGLEQRSIGLILEESSKSNKLLKELLDRHGLDDISTVAKKSDLPELLVWAIALEGKSDAERFEALGWPAKVYDVWNFSSCDERFGAPYPGRIPAEIVANTVYYYTKQGDLVIDPMAGSGTTVDVSLALGRRCYGFDIDPQDRKDIMQSDFSKETPKAIGKASLVFMDPPYWNMKDANYPEGSISRLAKDDYYAVFKRTANEYLSVMKSGARVAILIQNQTGQGKGGFKEDYLNHILKLQNTFIDAGWIDERTISCPMPPDNKGGSNEASAKKDHCMLGLVRSLLIFRKPWAMSISYRETDKGG